MGWRGGRFEDLDRGQGSPVSLKQYVFKRLRAVLSLEVNNVTFKLFPGRKEPLHDLESGHVAIDLTKKGQQPPQVPQEVMDICVAGDEVTFGESGP